MSAPPPPEPELAEALERMPPVLGFVGDSEDLGLFPPTLVDIDEFDDVRASGDLLACQLAEAGVEVQHVVSRGVPRWHLTEVGLAAVGESMDRMAAFIS